MTRETKRVTIAMLAAQAEAVFAEKTRNQMLEFSYFAWPAAAIKRRPFDLG